MRDVGPRCRWGPTPGREAVGMLVAHARQGTSPCPTGRDFVRIWRLVAVDLCAVEHVVSDRDVQGLSAKAFRVFRDFRGQ